MLILCLSALFLAAPIPKGANFGTIALITHSNAEKLELVLITPEGSEIKRVDLSELKGKGPYALKMSADGKRAVVTMQTEDRIGVGFNKHPLSVAYLVSLEGKDKPVTLFKNKLNPTLTLNRKGTTVYGSEWDQKKFIKNEFEESRSFRIDLATKVEQAIPLPVTHTIVDIDNEEATVLTKAFIEDKVQSFTASTKNWKPIAHLGPAKLPMCISPDGQKLLLRDLSNVTLDELLDGILKDKLMIYDLKNQKKQIIDKPRKDIDPIRFSFSPDGKRIALLGWETNSTENLKTEQTYSVYTCKTDGTEMKLIYKARANFDWHFNIDWK